MNDKDAATRGDLRIPDGELGEKIREEFEKGEGSVIVSLIMSIDSVMLICSSIGDRHGCRR